MSQFKDRMGRFKTSSKLPDQRELQGRKRIPQKYQVRKPRRKNSCNQPTREVRGYSRRKPGRKKFRKRRRDLRKRKENRVQKKT